MNNILFRFEKMTDASFKVLYTVETDDLKSFAGSVSMTLELNVFISKELQGSLVVDATKVLANAIKCALLIIIIIAGFETGMLSPEGVILTNKVQKDITL